MNTGCYLIALNLLIYYPWCTWITWIEELSQRFQSYSIINYIYLINLTLTLCYIIACSGCWSFILWVHNSFWVAARLKPLSLIPSLVLVKQPVRVCNMYVKYLYVQIELAWWLRKKKTWIVYFCKLCKQNQFYFRSSANQEVRLLRVPHNKYADIFHWRPTNVSDHYWHHPQ